MSDQPADRDPETGQFLKGKNGGPGRPKGSRNKLGEAFVTALQADFEEHGETVIATVRAERPADYLKVIASLLPKQVEIKESAFDGISDEELSALIAAARSALGVADGGAEGIGDTSGEEPPEGVPALH